MQILEKKACIFILNVLLYAGTCESAYAPIAQLDRVTGYEPVGQGFESLPARHAKNLFCIYTKEVFCNDIRSRGTNDIPYVYDIRL